MDLQVMRDPGVAAPWSPWRSIPLRPVRLALGSCAFVLAYAAAYHYGMAFNPRVSAPFWFPDSVLLCALLCVPMRWWWLLLAAVLPIRLLVELPPDPQPWFVGSVYVNDCAKAVLGALCLRRFLDDPIRLNSMRELGVYFLFVVVLIPLLSAFAGASARAGIGNSFWLSFEQWFLGNAMASLIVTPILFYWILRPPNPATFTSPRLIEAGVLAIGLLLTLAVAFEPWSMGPNEFGETRFYAPVVFMVWAAIRFRMYGATVAVGLLTIFALDAAIDRSGSFANMSVADTSSHLQHFLLLRAAPLYLAAVLIEQWSRVNDSLRESEARFRNIADQAPMMMWTSDRAGGCEFANRRWLDFTGMTLEENLGEGWSKTLHPDDVQKTFDIYRRHFSDRTPLEMEYRARRHDGEYRWIHVHGMPRFAAKGEFLGYSGSAIDITDRHQQEAALKRSEALYRDVVESQVAFVCRFLPDGTLTFVNTTWCELLGRARRDLAGGNFFELLPPAARTAAREAVTRAMASDSRAGWEFEVAHADGSRGWQSWVCHLIDAAPDVPREIQAIGYDITDRKRAEEAGRQLAHAARFAVVGELTAMVAHEVNQPLCAILSNAEAGEILLRSDQPPLDELRQILADIRQDDLRADAAIRGIRSLVHRRELDPEPSDLADIVAHVLKLTAGDALHRRVTIRQEFAAGLPRVIGDWSHLEQVFVILIVNAMDAMKETREGAREVLISARQASDEYVEVAVRDFGHGISTVNMPQLFDSLFTTKPEGMGLGLPIARTIIAAHGGRIWAENAPGGGAVFRFTLRTSTGAATG
jgi:PAS domain S-box-containing protein